jgi:hypothetical protein
VVSNVDRALHPGVFGVGLLGAALVAAALALPASWVLMGVAAGFATSGST